MKRFKKQWEIGLRWLRCGWRLFRRNPWLLGAMGFSCALLISVLTLIPLLGALLVAALAPMLLASAYLAIDTVSHQKLPLPAALRLAAVKQAPRALAAVLRDSERVLPTAVAGIYSMAVALLVSILVRALAGGAWVSQWTGLDIAALLGVLAIGVLALLIYFILAASLIYALPLAFLQHEPLIPMVGRSLKASAKYVLAVATVLGLLLAPFLLGAIASYLSVWATYLVWLITGTVVFPLVAASSYCSYRTLFPVTEPPQEE